MCSLNSQLHCVTKGSVKAHSRAPQRRPCLVPLHMPRSPQQLDLRAVRPPRLGAQGGPVTNLCAQHVVKDCERVSNYEIHRRCVYLYIPATSEVCMISVPRVILGLSNWGRNFRLRSDLVFLLFPPNLRNMGASPRWEFLRHINSTTPTPAHRFHRASCQWINGGSRPTTPLCFFHSKMCSKKSSRRAPAFSFPTPSFPSAMRHACRWKPVARFHQRKNRVRLTKVQHDPKRAGPSKTSLRTPALKVFTSDTSEQETWKPEVAWNPAPSPWFGSQGQACLFADIEVPGFSLQRLHPITER